jgi:glycosyltransferase involved in cell wall biosynthesis
MAAGKAVVSTSIGCEGIEVTPGKDILIGDTPREFADQVVRVCRGTALRQSLGQEGRALVERKYSWTLIGRKLNRMIEELVA